MKKRILSAIIAAFMLVAVTTPALAHGSKHGKKVNYPVCTNESCTRTGTHKHNGKTYAAHSYNDGHDYHNYCVLKDCDFKGYHEHDGYYCFARITNGGHK